MSGLERRSVRITGIVQGVGYRPFLWRRATRLGLGGHVENGPDGVTAEIVGSAPAVAAFLDGLATETPPLATVDHVAVEVLPTTPDGPPGVFVILESDRTVQGRLALIPPDIAPCAACLRELTDPADRRYGHPFISCTDCGPRYTIIESLPYDREATTMRAFPMCDACRGEYHDPAARRFHAETIACPRCGPSLWFATVGDGVPEHPATATVLGGAALDAAGDVLRRGGIVALKGVGGFHLACDGTNAAAVERLRERKRRLRKPFAVMVADLGAARRIAALDEQERRLLQRPERPIVLVRRRGDGPGVAAAVAPGIDLLGVMLPSSPLHHLLCAELPPLVMTSGNLSEEPIATANAEAVRTLAGIADAFLMHDRDIHVACDDSVVRCVVGVPMPIRRSRGHCPLPIRLPSDGPTVLAVGGELKAALCVASGTEAVMSQHVGDVGNLETLEALDRTVMGLVNLLGVSPEAVIADLHPGSLSARWAEQFAAARGIPCIRVQHHEAHVAALLAEHGLPLADAAGTIGVCFDGTGYGRDGTIQGGEMLVARRGVFRRAAHLVPFVLPGGAAAIRHPWRTALAVLQAAGLDAGGDLPSVAAAPPRELAIVGRQLAAGFGCVRTTSMGRLFDAVASLTGLRHSIDYEAEAAIELELAATASSPRYEAQAVPTADGTVALDWRPLVRGIVDDLAGGVPVGEIAGGFHDAIARLVADACRILRRREGCSSVALTGGVFQNARLVERTTSVLRADGFDVLLHRALPPNDGGIALGQAAIARHALSCK